MADKVVLGYWGFRGLAQPVRYFIEYLGLPYEEKRYQSPEEWGTESSQPPLSQEVLINLPYIKDGDKWVFESQALYVYLAHKAGKPELLGSTPEQQVLIAQVGGVLQDIFKTFFTLITLPEEQFNQTHDEFFKTNVLWIVEKLNKFISGKKYSTGDNVAAIDFLLYEVENYLRKYNPEIFAKQDALVKHHDAISTLPQIAAYIASERYLAAPFFPPGRFRIH